MNDRTIQYYDEHAEEFCSGTFHADMQECRDQFLQYLTPGQNILDAGCGSGRDTVAFLRAGYNVEAFDASPEICNIAVENTGIHVRCLRFEYLSGLEKYDGIWACASLLHVKIDDLPDVLKRLYNLLKKKGILYASFKYGSGERYKDERYFCDLTEVESQVLIESAGFALKEIFITHDVREGRRNERWINIIAGKNA